MSRSRRRHRQRTFTVSIALLQLRATAIESEKLIEDREPTAVGYRNDFVNTAKARFADRFYRVADRDNSGIDAYPRGSCEGTSVI